VPSLFAQDEEEGNYSLKIVESSNYKSVYDILHQMEDSSSTKDSYVPMDIFPRLVGRVYSQLSGKTLDDIETLSFGTSSLSMPKTSVFSALLAFGIPLSILAASASIFAPQLEEIFSSRSDDYGPYGIASLLADEYDSEDEGEVGAGEAFDFNSLMDSFENP